MRIGRWWMIFLISMWVVLQATPIAAARPAQTYPVDPAALEAFVDAYFSQALPEGQIPGAVVTLVQGGEIILSKGYGFASLEAQIPVDPAQTIWRVMSISKPVTAVAVLQLVEAGQLNLDADVRPLLPSVPFRGRDYGPITARQLLTHTAGLDFDLDEIGALPDSPASLLPPAQFFREFPPRRIQPPGEQYVYTNAAFDLLGLLVQNVSGMPFADYVEQHLFTPLQMLDSSFRQPPPGVARVAASYALDGETPVPYDYPYFQGGPSRTMTATAADMSNLLRALLDGGRLGSAQILQPEMVERLFSQSFVYAPGHYGSTFGLDEWPIGGGRALSKYGRGEGTISQIFLIPQDRLGYFVAYNLEDDFTLADDFPRAFVKTFYPADKPPAAGPMAVAVPATAARDLIGIYRSVDYSETTISKVLRLAGAPYPRVSVDAQGRVGVDFGDEHGWQALIPRGDGTFGLPDRADEVVFMRNAAGRVTHLVVGLDAAGKVPWWDRDALHLGLVFGFVICFAVGAVAWLRAARRLEVTLAQRRLYGALGVVAALNFVFLLTLLSVLQFVVLDYGPGMPWFMTALLAVALLTSVGVLGLPVWVVWLSRRSDVVRRGLWAAGAYCGVLIGFVAWLNYWNLLGFRW